MASIYTEFLKSPSAAALATNASLTYVSTTTTIAEPAAIVKHLQAQTKQVTKDDKILNAIESSNGSCFETETTLKFKSGGGAFLPGVDENLLDEKTVVLPMVHIVTFDAQQKISHIRVYWEQGTLLKQVEVIGRSGRNWPIRDGKALVDAVKGSVKTDTDNQGSASQGGQSARSVSVSATKDPHASLQLFSPRDPNAERREYDGPSVAPRASARPAPRDYSELFSNGEQAPSAKRSTSPSKIDGRTVKANAGKNFTENRLFDENTPLEAPPSPEKKRTYGQKYDHFAFGDGEEATQHQRGASKSSKAASHFSFEDFATPPKPADKPQQRQGQQRQWGAGIDEEDKSPERREVVHRPRPDAETHFEIADKSPAVPAQKDRTATNVDNTRREKVFGSQFEIADESPAGAAKPKAKVAPREELNPHWGFGGFGTPSPEKKIYKTAGDGMGGRGARSWGIGDSDPENDEEPRKSTRGRQAKAGADF